MPISRPSLRQIIAMCSFCRSHARLDRRLHDHERDRAAASASNMRDLLAQIRLPKAFAFVLNDGVPAALGLAVVEREYVGFYDIVVDAQQADASRGRQLMLNLP
ncbi:MAG: hypothetical protein U0528_09215 [Anaerolineae bacterium]